VLLIKTVFSVQIMIAIFPTWNPTAPNGPLPRALAVGPGRSPAC